MAYLTISAKPKSKPLEIAVPNNITELVMVNTQTGATSLNKATFNSRTKEFKWTPASGDSGEYEVKVTATDGRRTQEEIFKIKVKAAAN